MTITSTSSRQDYLGDGVSVSFAVPFPFFDSTEIRVIERVIATGIETALALGSAYTVTGGGGAAGSITALVAPAATKQWTILRNTRRTQEVDYQPNDPFPAETHERALDRLEAQVQEGERDAARSLRVAETDPPGSLTLPTSVDRALKTLGFNAAGEPVAVVPEAGSLVVTALAQTLLGNATAAQMLATLQASFIGEYREVAFVTLPAGWLWANGAAVSRVTYAALFEALGTSYGAGDGSTTFNLPDRCGRAAFGRDNMGGISAKNRLTSAGSGVDGSTLGATGGDQRIQSHTHTVNDSGHTHNVSIQGANVGVTAGGDVVAYVAPTGVTSTGSQVTGLTLNGAGAGNSQNVPPAIVVNVMIYAGA